MSRETSLYRYFDQDDRLLYVGISFDPVARQSQHRHSAEWYRDYRRSTVEWFSTREEALDAERKAILNESPIHNKRRDALPRAPQAKPTRVIEQDAGEPLRLSEALSVGARRLLALVCKEWWVSNTSLRPKESVAMSVERVTRPFADLPWPDRWDAYLEAVQELHQAEVIYRRRECGSWMSSRVFTQVWSTRQVDEPFEGTVVFSIADTLRDRMELDWTWSKLVWQLTSENYFLAQEAA